MIKIFKIYRRKESEILKESHFRHIEFFSNENGVTDIKIFHSWNSNYLNFKIQIEPQHILRFTNRLLNSLSKITGKRYEIKEWD